MATAYVDKDYYDTEYIGMFVDEAEFPRFEARARDVINQLTQKRITISGGLSAFTEDVQESIKKATCAQIEYYALYGIDVASAGMSGDSFTVGKVSVSGGGKMVGRTSMISPQTIMSLEQTGLMSNVVQSLRGGA